MLQKECATEQAAERYRESSSGRVACLLLARRIVEEKPVTVDLPPSVTVEVLEAPPAVKGDTAGNVQKTVTCENGLQVNVPLFIKQGEKIKVSTENKEYLGRA